MSAYTLFLNDEWDITLNEDGKIKTARDAYAVAQNASNAVRLFKNDAADYEDCCCCCGSGCQSCYFFPLDDLCWGALL